MTAYLEREGYSYSAATIHKYMNTEMGLHSIVRPKKPGTKPGRLHKIFENKLNQDFHADKPNKKWCTDFTYLFLKNGDIRYNCTIIDLHDRNEGGSAFVYAMGEDGCLARRQVETGRSFEGTKTEILSGLTGADYLAYPEEAAGKEGAKARIVYGEEMEIGTEESEEWEETGTYAARMLNSMVPEGETIHYQAQE